MAECCAVLLSRVRNTEPRGRPRWQLRSGAQEQTAFGAGKEPLGGQSGRNEAAGKEPEARSSCLQ